MSIYFIYHHQERSRVEPWANKLNEFGFDVRLASVGWEVGSSEWWNHVHQEMLEASLCIGFYSAIANSDPHFVDRCRIAAERGIFVPVRLDVVRPPEALEMFQALDGTQPDAIERALSRVVDRLPRPPRRVMCFTSYSRSDVEVAEQIEARLSAAGIETWRDIRDIAAGSSWDISIEKAICSCSHALVLISSHSIGSQNVADEISFAREQKKIIVPLLLDGSALPMRMHRSQAVDLRGDKIAGIAELERQLREYMSSTAQSKTTAQIRQPEPQSNKRPNRFNLLAWLGISKP